MKKRKVQVGGSWRMDETFIKVKVKGNGGICIGQLISLAIPLISYWLRESRGWVPVISHQGDS